MKTYTFDFNSKSNYSFRNKSNASKILDSFILSGLKDNTSDKAIIIPKKDKKIKININLNKKRTLDYRRYSDFIEAMNYFSTYYDNEDTYDFLLDDGTPIKFFDDEIQIGYDLIPRNRMTEDIFNALSSKSKKNIIDIYIKIRK